MFNRETLTGTIVGLVIGLLAGYLFGSRSQTTAPAPAAATTAQTPGGAPQGVIFEGLTPGAPSAPVAQAPDPRIFAAEQAVNADPKNVQAWISLGNFYFDSHQYQKSVDAYGKALALEPKNPDVLTDQGVMYKELHAYDKAAANFEKAQKLNPQHIQSLFNLGVVYSHDLHNPAKAQRAFLGVIELAPASPQAAEARKALESLAMKASSK